MTNTAEADALRAARIIIDDFGNHRRDKYFQGFADDATFIFHTHSGRLESRAEYERLWQEWEDDHGFHVHSCSSTKRRIQLIGDTAIFTHDVNTDLTMDGEREQSHERETIVFQHREDRWIAVHEHLSPR